MTLIVVQSTDMSDLMHTVRTRRRYPTVRPPTFSLAACFVNPIKNSTELQERLYCKQKLRRLSYALDSHEPSELQRIFFAVQQNLVWMAAVCHASVRVHETTACTHLSSKYRENYIACEILPTSRRVDPIRPHSQCFLPNRIRTREHHG
jgi:hypothetical protein